MTLTEVMNKSTKRVIGLMSGTSADGVDAALVRIDGHGMNSRIHQEAFLSIPFTKEVREAILAITRGDKGGSRELCLLGALLGQLYLEACQAVCKEAKISCEEVDLIGCHGQTVYHQPNPVEYLGRTIASTLQIGEPSLLCEKMGAIVVSDFRVRDMAAGGQGAPLVVYSEYLIYRSETDSIALQNIGGIGNITYLPAGCSMEEVIAFDTGPGNLLIDAGIARLTAGKKRYDEGGAMAACYPVDQRLLDYMMEDPYLKRKPPKTTGREYYDEVFLNKVYQQAGEWKVSDGEVLRTLTRYTAETIALSVRMFLPAMPKRLVIGGGGSYNLTLLSDIRQCLPTTEVVTNEELGFSSDAKEAVAFAILANEAIHGNGNNVPAATGADHTVIMGKISQ